MRYSADVILAGLIRALEANKQPRSKISILEFSTTSIGRSSTAGIPCTNSMHLKWVGQVFVAASALGSGDGPRGWSMVRALSGMFCVG